MGGISGIRGIVGIGGIGGISGWRCRAIGGCLQFCVSRGISR
jgi:hypothetical protein